MSATQRTALIVGVAAVAAALTVASLLEMRSHTASVDDDLNARPSIGNEQLDGAFVEARQCVNDVNEAALVVHDGIGGVQVRHQAKTEVELRRVDQEIERCLEPFREVADAYNEAHGPTRQELSESQDVLLDCLHSLGATVPHVAPALSELAEMDVEYPEECFDKSEKAVHQAVRKRGAAPR